MCHCPCHCLLCVLTSHGSHADTNSYSGNISQQFETVAFLCITWGSSVVVVAMVTPAFLIFSLFLSLAFVLIFLRFLPTSQSLRRLEMVSLSPLMSNFGMLLDDGLIIVRAFCAQDVFQDRVITVTDTFQKMDHYYWGVCIFTIPYLKFMRSLDTSWDNSLLERVRRLAVDP